MSKEPTKFCPKCKTEKPTAEFGINKTTPDGLQSFCRECCAKIEARRAYANEQSKRYYRTHKEQARKYSSAYRDKHQAEMTIYVRHLRAEGHIAPDHDYEQERKMQDACWALTKATGYRHILKLKKPISKGGMLHHDNMEIVRENRKWVKK